MIFGDEYIKFPKKQTKTQEKISRFIDYVSDQDTGAGSAESGLRANFITTNYDFTLEEIFDKYLGYDDCQELYYYRGFTPYSICERNNDVSHNDSLIRHFYKLNGGFEFIYKNNQLCLEYRKDELEKYYYDYSKQKEIILPNYYQDYNQYYFKLIFPKCVELLRSGKILVLIGTALPEEDYLLRQLLSNFAEQPADFKRKYIFYIGYKVKEQDIINNLFKIFPGFASSFYEENILIYTKGLISFIDELEQELVNDYKDKSIFK